METIKIKKGTVLFRIILLEEKAFLRDFYGKQEGTNDYCMPPNYNVFFYFNPFMSDTNLWHNGKWRKMFIYELQYDIEVLSFVKPCDVKPENYPKYLREDQILEKKNILLKCNNFDFCNGLYKGIDSDYCFTLDFMKKNPNILGMINIVARDNKNLKEKIKNKKYRWITKFMYKYLNHNGEKGIPELSIYPFNKRNFNHIRTKVNDAALYNNLINNRFKYNYVLKAAIDHQPFKKDELYNYVNKNLIMKDGFYFFKGPN